MLSFHTAVDVVAVGSTLKKKSDFWFCLSSLMHATICAQWIEQWTASILEVALGHSSLLVV